MEIMLLWFWPECQYFTCILKVLNILTSYWLTWLNNGEFHSSENYQNLDKMRIFFWWECESFCMVAFWKTNSHWSMLAFCAVITLLVLHWFTLIIEWLEFTTDRRYYGIWIGSLSWRLGFKIPVTTSLCQNWNSLVFWPAQLFYIIYKTLEW